jgi:glycosyltransferase involved in cell wall biosynthesis
MKLSVITVCYNSAKTLEHTIKSVKNQNYSLFEHIIIDGGSTDNTIELLKPLNINDNFIYISEPDGGIYDAMNKGISMASGDIIAILNADDFYPHSCIFQEVIDLFNTYSDVDFLIGGVKFVDKIETTNVVRSIESNGFSPWMIRFGFMPPHPASFIKKNCYERLGLYNTKYRIAADFDLFVRLFYSSNFKFKASNNFWVHMRVGGVSNSGLQSSLTITREMHNSLLTNGFYSSYILLFIRLPIKFFLQKFNHMILKIFK